MRRLIVFFIVILQVTFVGYSQSTLDLESPLEICVKFNDLLGEEVRLASDNKTQVNSSMIFYNNKGAIQNFDLLKESQIWKSDFGGKVNIKPIMSGDWLYHLISDVNEGNVSLKSINTSNGIVKWQVNFNYEKISSFSQTNDTLFLVTESGLIFYVDKVTGKIIRKNKLSFTPKLIDLFSDRILISSESSAILFKLDTLEKVFEITLNTSISTILLSSNNLFIGDVKGKLALFDSSTGKKKFEYKTGAKISHLIKTPKGILVTSLDNFFYLFLEDNLKLIWRNKTFSRNILLPKILGDLFIITNLNSNITEIFSLKRKELINRIVIEQDNLFLNEPIFVGNAIIFITLKGIYAFKNRGCI